MKIFIKTFGCQSIIADSEQLAGILSKTHKLTTEKQADLIIIMTCSVKDATESKQINYIKNTKKPMIIGGCLPPVIDLKKYSKNIIATFNTNTIKKVPEIIEKHKDILPTKKESKINLPRIRKNKDIAIINICQGCTGNCYYCSTRIARGSLKSYSITQIKKEFKNALKEGCTTFYLTGQDTGCYGLDIKTSLPKLLEELLKIEGNYKIRIGMMNPQYAKKYLKDLIKIYKNKHIIKFIHIPVQSGSDKVLKDMNRPYKAEDFIKVTKELRKEIKNIQISTDIIVGYPTETDKDFQLTLKLLNQTKPEHLNLSKFSARPKTKAQKLKQLNSKIIKERSKIIFKYKQDH